MSYNFSNAPKTGDREIRTANTFNFIQITKYILTAMSNEVKKIDSESKSKTTSNFPKKNQNSAKTGTLRNRLLVSILPTVLLPLIVASSIGYIITERRVKQKAIEQMEIDSVLSSTTIAKFIRNSFDSLDLVAKNPDLIQVMKDGEQKALEQKLTQQPIAALEEKFATTKSLAVSDKLDKYLEAVTQSDRFAEIFITESNGLNVSFSNPTSDFVQRDEGWWQMSQKNGQSMDEPEFDESANSNVIPFSRAVKDPQTGKFLGVIKAAIPTIILNLDLVNEFKKLDNQLVELQIVNLDNSFVLYDSHGQDYKGLEHNDEHEHEGSQHERVEHDRSNILGDRVIKEVVQDLVRVEGNSLSYEALQKAEKSKTKFWSLSEAQQAISQKEGFSEVSVRQAEILSKTATIASFKYRNNIYTVSTVPDTDFVSIEVVDYGAIVAEARNLIVVFALTALVLGSASLGLILLLAKQLSRPITNLSKVTQEVVQGNLEVTAAVEGTRETRTLANNFNELVSRVKSLLEKQQSFAEKQLAEKNQLELSIYTLIEEVGDATEGDLTVRANLDSMELSTVADLFNAIIDSLQDIAIEAKQSSRQVGSSLKENELAIRLLAEQAISEAKETRDTLMSVEQMSDSIQAVAKSANRAEQITDNTYRTIVTSTSNMDLTVDSILDLRSTVGETSKKMKRLGESSQKISQAVSHIEEIALKTNVLAINASVEAGRAGEYGQGFTIVAEQVGALAEQSAAATKEIASIVAAIQVETQQVNQAMESGTTQVVETTRLIENTKESLNLVLAKSQEVNQLMSDISDSTISQAVTSQNITKLMQRIAQLSEITSESSSKVAQSIIETAEVAAKLESAVGQFKVAE